MKKFFLSALVVASAGFGLVSCTNGDYDANPNTNNSNVGNPLNPGGGGSNSNFIKAKFNGTEMTFTNGGYQDTSGSLILAGFKGTVPSPDYEGMSLLITNFAGTKTYSSTDGSASTVMMIYNKVTNNVPQDAYTNTSTAGHVKINVTKHENNKAEGTFDAVIYKSGDSIVVTEGIFNLNKQ